MTDYRYREARRWLLTAGMLLALAMLLLMLSGCGGAPRTAVAAHTADASLEAAEMVLTDPEAAGLTAPELDEEQAEQVGAIVDRALRQIGGGRQLLAPVRHYLDPEGEQQAAVSAQEQLLLDDQAHREMTDTIAAEARQEAESRVWWRSLIAGWAQAAGTWSLSLLGLGSAGLTVAGIWAGARRWIRRGRELAHAIGWGEEADRLLRHPATPPEVRDAWQANRRALKRRQWADGVQGAIEQQRPRGRAVVAEARADTQPAGERPSEVHG